MDFEETLGGSLCNTEYPVSFCKVPAGDFLDAGVSVVREKKPDQARDDAVRLFFL